MPSERDIDNYINEIEEKNQIYMEEELEYAEKCHNLEEQLGCPLDVLAKILLYPKIRTPRLLASESATPISSRIVSTLRNAFCMESPMSILGAVIIVS